MDGVDKQDPSVENLTKTVDLWDNSSITIILIVTKAVGVMKKKMCWAKHVLHFL
jgi:hypothetical protein